MQTLNELATNLKALRDQKQSLQDELTEVKGEIEQVEQQLADAMIDEGNDSFSLNGYVFTLKVKDMFSSRVEFREELLDALKLHGYDRENIITETIPSQKLNSIMRDIYEDNDDELPEEFEGIVSVFSKRGITVHKKRGASRAGKKFE